MDGHSSIVAINGFMPMHTTRHCASVAISTIETGALFYFRFFMFVFVFFFLFFFVLLLSLLMVDPRSLRSSMLVIRDS